MTELNLVENIVGELFAPIIPCVSLHILLYAFTALVKQQTLARMVDGGYAAERLL